MDRVEHDVHSDPPGEEPAQVLPVRGVRGALEARVHERPHRPAERERGAVGEADPPPEARAPREAGGGVVRGRRVAVVTRPDVDVRLEGERLAQGELNGDAADSAARGRSIPPEEEERLRVGPEDRPARHVRLDRGDAGLERAEARLGVGQRLPRPRGVTRGELLQSREERLRHEGAALMGGKRPELVRGERPADRLAPLGVRLGVRGQLTLDEHGGRPVRGTEGAHATLERDDALLEGGGTLRDRGGQCRGRDRAAAEWRAAVVGPRGVRDSRRDTPRRATLAAAHDELARVRHALLAPRVLPPAADAADGSRAPEVVAADHRADQGALAVRRRRRSRASRLGRRELVAEGPVLGTTRATGAVQRRRRVGRVGRTRGRVRDGGVGRRLRHARPLVARGHRRPASQLVDAVLPRQRRELGGSGLGDGLRLRAARHRRHRRDRRRHRDRHAHVVLLHGSAPSSSGPGVWDVLRFATWRTIDCPVAVISIRSRCSDHTRDPEAVPPAM